MSRLLTAEVAQKAVEFLLPAIKQLMDSSVFKRDDLHIVIAKPLFPDNRDEVDWHESGILYEYSMGDREKWEYQFQAIARAKCYMSWRTGMSTQMLQVRAPHLLQKCDTVFYGSAVSDGLVVACSGVQPFYDQMISHWVLEACRALCIQGRETFGEGDQGFIC